MKLVRWCVRAGLWQDWRGLAVLTLIAALMGAVALAAVAGARRTDTAVARFLQYAGPFQGQVAADPAVLEKIAALPGVAYSQQAQCRRGDLFLFLGGAARRRQHHSSVAGPDPACDCTY